LATLTFRPSDKLYLRDPQHTTLGMSIIQRGIELIDRLGFEQFTFKKLAAEIGSTEASIYRYFINKHRLLAYLISWYWNWEEYRVTMATASLIKPEDKLRAAIRVISSEKKADPNFDFITDEALYRIVLAELDKAYLTKSVDHDHRAGLFEGLQSLSLLIAGFISETSPGYAYAQSLSSTLLFTVNRQLFFAEHIPPLSNFDGNESRQDQHQRLFEFAEKLVFGAISR
jgi:AcrR family transcriptional regulator